MKIGRVTFVVALLATLATADIDVGPDGCGAPGACARSAVNSCKDVWDGPPMFQETLVWVKPRSDKPAYQARCANRGWDLVLKIDGSRNTFGYASDHWTNYSVLAGGSTDPKAADVLEAKFPSFKYMAGTEIMLERVVKGRRSVFTRMNVGPFRSLRHLIASTPETLNGAINHRIDDGVARTRINSAWKRTALRAATMDAPRRLTTACGPPGEIRGVGLGLRAHNSLSTAGSASFTVCFSVGLTKKFATGVTDTPATYYVYVR